MDAGLLVPNIKVFFDNSQINSVNVFILAILKDEGARY